MRDRWKKGKRVREREFVSFFSKKETRPPRCTKNSKKMPPLARRFSMPPPAPGRPGPHQAGPHAAGRGAALVCDEELLLAVEGSPVKANVVVRKTSSPSTLSSGRSSSPARKADECDGVKRCFNHLQNQPLRANEDAELSPLRPRNLSAAFDQAAALEGEGEEDEEAEAEERRANSRRAARRLMPMDDETRAAAVVAQSATRPRQKSASAKRKALTTASKGGDGRGGGGGGRSVAGSAPLRRKISDKAFVGAISNDAKAGADEADDLDLDDLATATTTATKICWPPSSGKDNSRSSQQQGGRRASSATAVAAALAAAASSAAAMRAAAAKAARLAAAEAEAEAAAAAAAAASGCSEGDQLVVLAAAPSRRRR